MKNHMKTKSVGVNLLMTVFGICLIGCHSQPKISFKPTNTYAFDAICIPQNINTSSDIPDHISSLLEDKERVRDDAFIDAFLEKSAREIAAQSTSVDACQETLEQGQTIFDKTLMINRQELANRGGYQQSNDPKIQTIQQDITYLWADDQSARSTMLNLGTEDTSGSGFWAQQLSKAHAIATDHTSTQYIEKLLDSYDWVDKERFGTTVSQHAWILVQHADDRPDLQARVLKNMELYLEKGHIKPANYAYLWDRVAVNTGRKQRYGTQPTWECTNGQLELQPLENPENVNQRRAQMNMDTVEEGLANMSAYACK